MAKFRLLRGVHNEGGRTYKVGDVIDSASDLSKHNKDVVRFEPLSEGSLGGHSGLESMTIAQLKQHAEEEEIDLGDATKRSEILAICQEAQPEPLPS